MVKLKIIFPFLVFISLIVTQLAGAIDAASLKAFFEEYNEREEKWWPRLAYAIEKGHVDIAEYLILKGDPVTIYFAESWPSPIGNDKFQNRDCYYKHPFLTAISRGYVDLVILMMHNVSDLSKAEEYKRVFSRKYAEYHEYTVLDRKNALIVAITESPKSFEIVDALLNYGLNVNEVFCYGKYNANANSRDFIPFIDYTGKTPLKAAVELKKLDVAELLLTHKADVEQLAPLYMAVEKNDLEGVVLLLNYGADPLKGDPSPLDIAMKENRTQMVNVLLNAAIN